LSICEFCEEYQVGLCRLNLRLPKTMSCHQFAPTLTGFCSEAADFVSPRQIVEMATYFGMKGSELRKVKAMAAREDTNRQQPREVHEDQLGNEVSTTAR